jgi:hypothetical protein
VTRYDVASDGDYPKKYSHMPRKIALQLSLRTSNTLPLLLYLYVRGIITTASHIVLLAGLCKLPTALEDVNSFPEI